MNGPPVVDRASGRAMLVDRLGPPNEMVATSPGSLMVGPPRAMRTRLRSSNGSVRLVANHRERLARRASVPTPLSTHRLGLATFDTISR